MAATAGYSGTPLARKLGVSVSTVSRALSDAPGIGDDLRRQIQKLATETGYRPRTARNRVAQSTPRKVVAFVTLDRVTGGLASFYGQGHGTKTANGESFTGRELTAAHRTLPFGTRVRVTNVSTGRSVTVRVNDRGPFVPGRVIDVSQAAAEQLGMVGRGVTKVKLDVVQ